MLRRVLRGGNAAAPSPPQPGGSWRLRLPLEGASKAEASVRCGFLPLQGQGQDGDGLFRRLQPPPTMSASRDRLCARWRSILQGVIRRRHHPHDLVDLSRFLRHRRLVAGEDLEHALVGRDALPGRSLFPGGFSPKRLYRTQRSSNTHRGPSRAARANPAIVQAMRLATAENRPRRNMIPFLFKELKRRSSSSLRRNNTRFRLQKNFCPKCLMATRFRVSIYEPAICGRPDNGDSP